MAQLFANNAVSTLAVAVVDNSITSFTVATGDGAKFPSPATPDFAVLTITQAGTETSWEEVKLTSRSGDVLTVVRNFEGSGAAWGIGSKVELRITASYLNATGYIGLPQNAKSVAYTLQAGDAGSYLLHPSADTTARTFTIPANSSVPYPVGTALTFVNQSGAGTLTIAITTDTMRLAGGVLTGSRTLAANGIATALKLTATEWIISGVGLT